jgi:thiamine biosynthesis lipoprotein
MAERAAHRIRHVEEAMGTVFSFDVRAAEQAPAVEEALDEARAWLHRVDGLFSTYRPDSPVSRLRRGEITPGQLPPVVTGVLRLCEEAEARTGGAFSLRPDGLPDPTGLVKGWAVERAAALLMDAGATGCCVNGAGDIQLRGEAAPGEPWRVGIADPRRAGELLTVVAGRDLAVATSGITERGTHITDPRDGSRPAHLLAATVTGAHMTWADAYATAAVVLGPAAGEWIAGVDGYELLAVPAEGAPTCSAAFPAAG